MNLYVDDNTGGRALVGQLRRVGHQVILPADVGLSGAHDPRHLARCALEGWVLLTYDHEDFLELHDLVQATRGRHAGVLVVRSDSDPSRDMKDRDIVRAIANLEGSGLPVANEYHVLNHWR